MDDRKRCNTCKMMRALSEFNVRTAAADGLQARCREWYLKHRAEHIANVARRKIAYRQELRVQLAAYFATHPCVDCGERNVRCLEFDHRDRSTKRANVAYLLGGALSWKAILAEIEKCDVRCANRHSRRTAAQVNSWRHQLVVALKAASASAQPP
jgi:hypothetical protein